MQSSYNCCMVAASLLIVIVGAIPTQYQHQQSLADSRDELGAYHVGIATHHKSGTILGEHLSRCARLNLEHLSLCPGIGQRWEGKVGKCNRVVHMLRHPVNMYLSSYLYNRQKPPVEPHLKRPATHMIQDAGLALLRIQPKNKEAYNDFLARVPPDVGILADMYGPEHSAIREMEQAFELTRSNKQVTSVCLENVFMNFAASMSRVLRTFGRSITDTWMSCTAGQDPSNLTFGTHTTTLLLSSSARNKYLAYIKEYDSKYFNKTLTRSLVATHCPETVKLNAEYDVHLGDYETYTDWIETFA